MTATHDADALSNVWFCHFCYNWPQRLISITHVTKLVNWDCHITHNLKSLFNFFDVLIHLMILCTNLCQFVIVFTCSANRPDI